MQVTGPRFMELDHLCLYQNSSQKNETEEEEEDAEAVEQLRLQQDVS